MHVIICDQSDLFVLQGGATSTKGMPKLIVCGIYASRIYSLNQRGTHIKSHMVIAVRCPSGTNMNCSSLQGIGPVRTERILKLRETSPEPLKEV